LWLGKISSSKPLYDDMKIYDNSRSETVIRALSDFGIEESFANAAARFEEHYHYKIGPSAVVRSTKATAQKAIEFLEDKFSDVEPVQEDVAVEKILVELDGCEIRTAILSNVEGSTEITPVYNNPKKTKTIKWRDVRLSFARPLDSESKLFAGKMDSYPNVVSQLHSAAVLSGMTPKTQVIGIADGGIGLSEELKKQFPTMQFILDKSHLRDHLYDTAQELGIKEKKRPAWVNLRLKDISAGKIDTVLKELVDENEKNPNERRSRLIGYINRFYESLNYEELRSKGYPIGSGEIESAHKSIPQKRLKIPGASWSPSSINPMLSLRILRANGWWEEFWNNRMEELLSA
jgi:hypothetical protein